ncbi:MAG: SGNH/GDSL hydrolase family protein [Ignavibacteria bacterium]|jgi:lysophospholipase L1-like esterase|nr:SGNH/GDSL hydrolase family protein [Ignavibacteria bacterium]MDH7528309.1 SGNH/GDSL hydrolase family protein [Ignavibacteria bacterium]
MKKVLSILVILTVFLAIGCEDRSELTPPSPPSTGSVSFERFVTLGNSLTAGYQNGALYESAQMYSFGKLIADQVGAAFEQPLVADPGTGGRLELQGLTSTGIQIYVNPNQGQPKNYNLNRPYNNLAVPGAFLYDIANATSSTTCYSYVFGGQANPLFDLVLRGQGSQLTQAKALNPTLITLWIGNNDILGHATSGGTVPYTPEANFAFLYNALATELANTGSKVVVANIPDVTAIPFFTTVGPTLYAQGITAVWAVRGVGDTVPVNVLTNYLTLRASDLLAQGKGMSEKNPLPNSVVLDSIEAANVKNVISNYNATIASVAAAKGFGLVDANALLNRARTGITENGIRFTTQYVTGGLFSLDGVHPTNRGYAIVANEFIKVINQKWGASIPLINVSTIPGSIILPKGYNQLGLPVLPAGALDNLLF